MKKSGIVISCFLLAASLLLVSTPNVPVAKAAPAFARTVITSNVTELGPNNVINQTFTVKFLIENITNLYGVDIQITWPTEFINQVSHVKKIPRNVTTPAPPGTYPDGVLYPSTIPVKDTVDETASMPGSELGTRYWLVEASLYPAWKFNGTGTAFEMTFKVVKQPVGIDTNLYINMTGVTLADYLGTPINHTQSNWNILLHGRTQPAGPSIEVSSVNYKGTVPYAFVTTVSIMNLDAYWDLGGFDLQLSYDPELLQAGKITVDPNKWFNASWLNGEFVVMNLTDNVNGKVWVAVVGLPGVNGTHTPLSGSATLFTVEFSAIASAPILKVADPFSLASFPHPDRPESPYNGSQSSIPIPFTTTNGFAHVIGVMQHTPMAGYTVTTESNSSVPTVFFEPGVPMLMFNVTGATGYEGFVNITIPNNFMWSSIGDSGWFVLVNGLRVTPTVTSDASNTYLYFTYHQSTNFVTIVTSNAVPEFGLAAIAILMLAALGIVLTKKLATGKKE